MSRERTAESQLRPHLPRDYRSPVHTCHRCGAHVEDGQAFCAQCGAPQIRVAPAEPEEPATVPFPPDTPGEVQPPALPVYPPPPPLTVGGLSWRTAYPSILLIAVGMALFNLLLPLAGLGFFLWTLAGGALVCLMYVRKVPGASLTAGSGARLGAVTGLIAFGIYSVTLAALLALQTLVFKQGDQLRNALRQSLEQAAMQNPTPEVQAMVQRLSSPEGLAILVTIGLVVFLFGFVLLSTIGGALGGGMFGRRRS